MGRWGSEPGTFISRISVIVSCWNHRLHMLNISVQKVAMNHVRSCWGITAPSWKAPARITSQSAYIVAFSNRSELNVYGMFFLPKLNNNNFLFKWKATSKPHSQGRSRFGQRHSDPHCRCLQGSPDLLDFPLCVKVISIHNEAEVHRAGWARVGHGGQIGASDNEAAGSLTSHPNTHHYQAWKRKYVDGAESLSDQGLEDREDTRKDHNAKVFQPLSGYRENTVCYKNVDSSWSNSNHCGGYSAEGRCKKKLYIYIFYYFLILFYLFI